MEKLFTSSGQSSMDICVQSSSPSVLRTSTGSGDIYNLLEGTMGERHFKELKASDCLRLNAIDIRSRKVQRGCGDKKGIINHDIAVVELEEGPPKSAGGVNLYHIHAEKLHNGPNKSGIRISWPGDFKFNKRQDKKYDCFGTRIRLDEVLEVLTSSNADYHLLKANCWHYAAVVTQDLILKLLDRVKDEKKSTSQLQDVLTRAKKHLEDTETIIPKAVGASTMAMMVGGAIMGAAVVLLKFVKGY